MHGPIFAFTFVSLLLPAGADIADLPRSSTAAPDSES